MKLEHGGDWTEFKRQYGYEPLDYSANTSPLGMSPMAIEAAKMALEYSDRYPDPRCTELREALSEWTGVPQDRFVFGNGAAELIDRLVRATKPKTALIAIPTFSEYEHALRRENCEVRKYPLSVETEFRILPDFLDWITDDLDIVFLCEPNNPTGIATEQEMLQDILRKCRETNTLLVLDECFAAYTTRPLESSLVQELGDGCLVSLNAFTKFYGMAGLRLGIIATDEPGLVQKMNDCASAWTVSLPAQAAGVAALKDKEYERAAIKLVHVQRGLMYQGLRMLGFDVLPGAANFLLFHCKIEDLADRTREKGVLIRDCSNFEGLSKGWYRVAVRTEEENLHLLRVLGGCI